MTSRHKKALKAVVVVLAFAFAQVYVLAGLPAPAPGAPQRIITAKLATKGNAPITVNGNAAYINGELHRYEQYFYNGNTTPVWTDVATVARYITSSTPFTVPLNASGTPDSRYVGVKISAGNTNYSNRGYHDISTLLNTAIPYRSKLTIYQ